MKFIDWFPYYQEIRQEFGYSTEKDQEAAIILSKMIKRKALDLKVLQKKITGRQVMIIGAGPGLEKNIAFVKKNTKFVKVVADSAVQFLIQKNVKPHIVVTDLDGNHIFLQRAEKMGSIIVVHAHGDNVNILKKMVPKFKHLIGSTQIKPVENVYNFGGFTDGDRCVFLADEFRAKEIVLVGMELKDRVSNYSTDAMKNVELKKAKMIAGKRLLEMLAKRSNSQLFDTSHRPIKGFRHFAISYDY